VWKGALSVGPHAASLLSATALLRLPAGATVFEAALTDEAAGLLGRPAQLEPRVPVMALVQVPAGPAAARGGAAGGGRVAVLGDSSCADDKEGAGTCVGLVAALVAYAATGRRTDGLEAGRTLTAALTRPGEPPALDPAFGLHLYSRTLPPPHPPAGAPAPTPAPIPSAGSAERCGVAARLSAAQPELLVRPPSAGYPRAGSPGQGPGRAAAASSLRRGNGSDAPSLPPFAAEFGSAAGVAAGRGWGGGGPPVSTGLGGLSRAAAAQEEASPVVVVARRWAGAAGAWWASPAAERGAAVVRSNPLAAVALVGLALAICLTLRRRPSQRGRQRSGSRARPAGRTFVLPR
jgi:hypothetical protein